MNRDDLEELEKKVMKTVVERRALGGFDANAATILLMSEWMLQIVQHLREAAPKIKK